jgi:hypothetical protein
MVRLDGSIEAFLRFSRLVLSAEDLRETVRAVTVGQRDSAEILWLALRHGNLPVTSANLLRAGLLDGPVRQFAEAVLRVNSLLSTALFEETLRLARRFAESHVKVVVWKGVTLSHTLYPDPDLRPSHDIDLLCSPEDLDRATDILSHSGYQFLHRIAGESGFHRIEDHWSLIVEVHTEVPFFPERFAAEAIEGAVQKQFNETDLWCLNDTDDLMALVSYVTVHKPIYCFRYLNDFDAMIRLRNIRWERVAAWKRLKTNVYLVLTMLNELFGRELAIAEEFAPGGWRRRLLAELCSKEGLFQSPGAFARLRRYLLFRWDAPHRWHYLAREVGGTLREALKA